MDLPDSDWGDFSCRRAVDSSSFSFRTYTTDLQESLEINLLSNIIYYDNAFILSIPITVQCS